MKVFSLGFLSLHKQHYFQTVQGTHYLAFAHVLVRVKDLMYNLHSFRLHLIFSPLAGWCSVLINPLSQGKLSGKCHTPDLPSSTDAHHSSLEGDLFPPSGWQGWTRAKAHCCCSALWKGTSSAQQSIQIQNWNAASWFAFYCYGKHHREETVLWFTCPIHSPS